MHSRARVPGAADLRPVAGDSSQVAALQPHTGPLTGAALAPGPSRAQPAGDHITYLGCLCISAEPLILACSARHQLGPASAGCVPCTVLCPDAPCPARTRPARTPAAPPIPCNADAGGSPACAARTAKRLCALGPSTPGGWTAICAPSRSGCRPARALALVRLCRSFSGRLIVQVFCAPTARSAVATEQSDSAARSIGRPVPSNPDRACPF